MARTPAPPGPPPPHYRPPGAPRTPLGMPAPTPPAPSTGGGIGAGAATAVAVLTLLVGLVAGFFLGRAYGADESVATRTTGTIAPAPSAPAPAPSRPPGDTVPQQVPGGPPPTDLAPSGLGSIDEPVPAGQSYVLGLYEIEVRGVDRDAGDALTEFDPSNPPASDGEQHVLVELAVRFTDAAGLGSPGAIPFFVSDGVTEWSGFDSGCGRVPDALAQAGFIELGDEVVGQVCFSVPSDAVDALVLGTESFAGPLWFALP